MKGKLKIKLKRFLNKRKFLDEEISNSYSGHTYTSSNIRVLENLLRQKHMEMEQQQPRRLADIINSEEYPSNSEVSWAAVISFGIIGIMLMLMVWLVISYVQINNKYEKLAKSISQQNTLESSSLINQDTSIDDLEDKLAQIEKKVSTYMDQSKLNEVTTPEGSEKVEDEQPQNIENTEDIKPSKNPENNTNIKQSQNVQKSEDIKQSQSPEQSANDEEPKNPEKVENTEGSENETSDKPSDKADKLPEDGKYREYTIQKGDTLWKISTRFFGDGKKANEIMQINELKDPDNLEVGKTIRIPAK